MTYDAVGPGVYPHDATLTSTRALSVWVEHGGSERAVRTQVVLRKTIKHRQLRSQ